MTLDGAEDKRKEGMRRGCNFTRVSIDRFHILLMQRRWDMRTVEGFSLIVKKSRGCGNLRDYSSVYSPRWYNTMSLSKMSDIRSEHCIPLNWLLSFTYLFLKKDRRGWRRRTRGSPWCRTWWWRTTMMSVVQDEEECQWLQQQPCVFLRKEKEGPEAMTTASLSLLEDEVQMSSVCVCVSVRRETRSEEVKATADKRGSRREDAKKTGCIDSLPRSKFLEFHACSHSYSCKGPTWDTFIFGWCWMQLFLLLMQNITCYQSIDLCERRRAFPVFRAQFPSLDSEPSFLRRKLSCVQKVATEK